MTFASAWHPTALRLSWPGIVLSGMIALAASFISLSYGGPQLLYSLFFGLAFHFLFADPICRPGIEFCSKILLRTGVALLGVRITVDKILSIGAEPILTVLCALVTTMVVGWSLAKWLKRPVTEGLLSGGAVAICGASAALAIAAALPQTKENEKFTLLVVVGVTALSTLAMIVYPLIVKLLGLDDVSAGIFIGGTIHDVAQVIGAGYLISNQTGDIAIFVKLARVACLVPVVLVITLMFQSRDGTTKVNTLTMMPFFLFGFIGLVITNNFGVIPPPVINGINEISRACLVTAIAALGVKTSFQSLASLGWRPILMLVAETVWVALFMLVSLMFKIDWIAISKKVSLFTGI